MAMVPLPPVQSRPYTARNDAGVSPVGELEPAAPPGLRPMWIRCLRCARRRRSSANSLVLSATNTAPCVRPFSLCDTPTLGTVSANTKDTTIHTAIFKRIGFPPRNRIPDRYAHHLRILLPGCDKSTNYA